MYLKPENIKELVKISNNKKEMPEEEKMAFHLSTGEKCDFLCSVNKNLSLCFQCLIREGCQNEHALLQLLLSTPKIDDLVIWETSLKDLNTEKWENFTVDFISKRKDIFQYLNINEEIRLTFILQPIEKPEANTASIFISEPMLLPHNFVFMKGEKENQNVILISLDTLRADHLSVYGYPRKTSPCISDIAKQGTLFKKAYSSASWTLPSHISLFTGVYSSRLTNSPISQQNIWTQYKKKFCKTETMANLYEKKGYFTAAFTGGGAVCSEFGFSNGFHLYINDEGTTGNKDKTEKIFRKSIEWIKKVNKSGNFFLFLHTYEVHQPHLHRYFIKKGSRGGRLSRHKNITKIEFSNPTPEEKEFAADLYDSSIYRVDQYLGRLMDELRHLKLLDKTLIIILGDHGEDIWDHEDFGHCEMYEEVLHVPLIFYNLPGIPPGSIFENLVSLLDLFPTLIKIHKLTPTQALSVDGIDLSPLFQKTLLPPRKIFSECWVSSDPDNINQKDISVIDENYHYIRRFEQTTLSILREQLYFIPNDPLEQRDIAKLLPKKLKTYQTLTDNFLSKISSPKEKDAPPEKLPYSGEEESKLMDKLKALGYF